MMMIFKLTEVRILLRFHEFSPNALFLFEDRSKVLPPVNSQKVWTRLHPASHMIPDTHPNCGWNECVSVNY